MLPEGPFGDHTGFYTPQEPFPALTIDCVTMGSGADPSIVVGRPPTEDDPRPATSGSSSPAQDHRPDIVDYTSPKQGVSTTARSSRSTRNPQARQKVMHAVWGPHDVPHQADRVVDSTADAHDLHEVACALGNTDYSVISPSEARSTTSTTLLPEFWGGKAGIDATRKCRGGLHPGRGLARDGAVRPETASKVDAAGRSTACEALNNVREYDR